jgi:hypothetical protein
VSPKHLLKVFGSRRMKKLSQLRALKPHFVRRGPIRCPAPRARPRYTQNALSTADIMKSEARRRGPDASAAQKPKTPSSTFGQAMLMASQISQAAQGRVSLCMAAWTSAPLFIVSNNPLPLRLPPRYIKSAPASFPIPISRRPTSRRS